MTSAYPAPIEMLIPQARKLAATLGQVPSRNKLMTEFKIGAKKATQLRDVLTETGTDPATTPGRRLHAVPSTTTGPDTTQPEPAPADPTPADLEPARPDSTPATTDSTDEGTDGTAPAGQVSTDANPPAPAESGARPADRSWWGWTRRLPASWPLFLLALPAFVAIWSGWVGLGELTGFGLVHPLPGIADGFTLNTAITLPIGVETYAAYALRVALASGGASKRAKRFAGWSAVASLALGFLGQVAYHLMTVRHITVAPWWITTIVSGLPVIVLGCGAALSHLQHRTSDPEVTR